MCWYKNAGVAGYAEAFRPVQSDSQTSDWYSYFENDVLDVRTLVSRMARAFFGENYYLLTDTLMSSKEASRIMREEKNNQRVFEMFDHVTISVSGIGSFYPTEESVLASPDFMSTEDLEKLKQENVSGDIALRFFDHDGQECNFYACISIK